MAVNQVGINIFLAAAKDSALLGGERNFLEAAGTHSAIITRSPISLGSKFFLLWCNSLSQTCNTTVQIFVYFYRRDGRKIPIILMIHYYYFLSILLVESIGNKHE